MTEEEAYNIALQELQGQNVVQGIWAKAMAFSEGDEKKAKANYLRFRAEQILQKERVFVSTSISVGILAVLFSPYGRIPRWLFAAVVGFAIFVIVLGVVIIDSARYSNEGLAITLCLPFFALSGWAIIVAHIKRARDAGVAPYFILYYLIPVLGWVFLLYFLFCPSEVDPVGWTGGEQKGSGEQKNEEGENRKDQV
jgi:uncharacterized membrane protein YhaH (DUF805 family)